MVGKVGLGKGCIVGIVGKVGLGNDGVVDIDGVEGIFGVGKVGNVGMTGKVGLGKVVIVRYVQEVVVLTVVVVVIPAISNIMFFSSTVAQVPLWKLSSVRAIITSYFPFESVIPLQVFLSICPSTLSGGQ